MKAVLCKSLDGPDGLVVEDIASPVPADDEIVLKVEAVSLNFYDTLMCRGKYQRRPQLPFSPGGEAVGTVIAVGAAVKNFRVGERVLSYMGENGAREEVAVRALTATHLPEGLSSELAVALPVTYGTALHGLEDRGRLVPGETLLVLGATGGAGLAAVEIGTVLGARVIAAGTSDEKLKLCEERGAHKLLNLSSVGVANLKDALRDLTGGAGVDVIYDCIGGDYTEPSLRALAWGGRHLVIGFAAGAIPSIPVNLLLLKGCELVGVHFGRHAQLHRKKYNEQMSRLIAWCAQGRIRPHIDRVFPLEETAEALKAIEGRKIKGKVIIKPGGTNPATFSEK